MRNIGFNDIASSARIIGSAGYSFAYLLHRDDNFQSICSSITRDWPTLRGLAIGNDSVSSVRGGSRCSTVGDREVVTLYEDWDYLGASMIIDTSIPDLRVIGFNDRTSSFKFKLPSAPAALYSEVNYAGKCSTLKGDAPKLDTLTVGNDSVSSIKLDSECP
ncbi:MAG: hypothetical protein NTZ05_05765 [Chloroflexi bacterium]|nr:hypothetical protein [Chloroflexota bacterium]